jgi:hypothetical protein
MLSLALYIVPGGHGHSDAWMIFPAFLILAGALGLAWRLVDHFRDRR